MTTKSSKEVHRRVPRTGAASASNITRMIAALVVLMVTGATGAHAQSQPTDPLVSRADLVAAARRADSTAARNPAAAGSALYAASLRQRLREGDFQVGDRIVVTILSDSLRRDTVTVRGGRLIELPGKVTIPLEGVLRSELQQRVTDEVLKLIRAERVEAVPLTRIGVLGEVMRPGYFSLAWDTPLTDAIMSAGGPSPSAEMERSAVKRDGKEFRSPKATREAISRGLTIEQFGLRAGDELFVGRRREFNPGPMVAVVGAVASIVTVYLALRPH